MSNWATVNSQPGRPDETQKVDLTTLGASTYRLNPGWPAHLLTSYHVHVEMVHAVQGVPSHVEDQSVAVGRDPEGLRPVARRGEHLRHDLAMPRLHASSIVYVNPGYDKEMHRCHRVEVEESVRVVRGKHLPRRQVTCDNPAEDTFDHEVHTTLVSMAPAEDWYAPDPNAVDDLLGRLGAWQASERVSEAAAERARSREMLERAASTSTWTGALVDLAETSSVVVADAAGYRVTGRLVGVGKDFVTFEATSGRPTLVPIDALVSITPVEDGTSARTRRPAGARVAPLATTMATVLDLLWDESAPVTIRTESSSLHGVIVAVGEDLVSLRLEGQELAVHVRSSAITCCEIF